MYTLVYKINVLMTDVLYLFAHYNTWGWNTSNLICHMLRYVYIAYLVQYAEYLMGCEAKYFLTVRFISFAMIRLASIIN